MRDWLRRFMAGRYGGDAFSGFLCAAAVVCMLLGLFTWDALYILGMALLVYNYFRILSRNTQKRAAENRWYLARRASVQGWFSAQRQRFAHRKEYRYFRCPRCGQTLRVPRGRGRISICCPKCGTQFIKKS